MKRAIRRLLTPALMAVGFLAAAAGQQSANSNNVDEPQPILWQDHAAVEGLNDVLFHFNSDQIASQPEVLQAAAQWLKDHPDVQVNLAGYADPRGDIVYNLGLSQQRADTVKQKLIELGVPEDRIVFHPGWGKLYQSCLDPTDDCWKQNRRVQFEYANPLANGPSR
jgi:outer membrane protein OmpA-like peptidoglycan-associated protein